MGPMSKRTVDAVLCAVSLGVCLMNADSSFVVAQVIPPFCVSSSSMQEGTPEVQKEGKNSLSLVTQVMDSTLPEDILPIQDAAVDNIFANSAPSLMLRFQMLHRTPKTVTTQYEMVFLPKRQWDYETSSSLLFQSSDCQGSGKEQGHCQGILIY